MEEFLVYTHKKRVLTLTAKQRELLIEMPDELVRATISVNKNTWGYTHTYITSDSDFLIPEATRITGQDFTGNNYELNFLIDPTKIPEGVSAGYIHFNNTAEYQCKGQHQEAGGSENRAEESSCEFHDQERS